MLKGWAVNDPKYKEANITIIKSCKEDDPCFLFNMLGPQGADIGDTWAGVILLLISLVMLCSCLMGMVKLLNSLLGEKVREAIKEGVNKDIPIQGLAWLTGYLAMLVGDTITITIPITIQIHHHPHHHHHHYPQVGAILPVLVQSSSVFTSTLTPLAGAGLVSLQRAYPLTLGSNIGASNPNQNISGKVFSKRCLPRNNQHKLASSDGGRGSPCQGLGSDRTCSPPFQYHWNRHFLPDTFHAVANTFSTGDIYGNVLCNVDLIISPAAG